MSQGPDSASPSSTVLGALPETGLRFRERAGQVIEERFAPRPPGAAEVVIEVAGSALGAAAGAEVAGVVVASGEAARDWLGRPVVTPRLLPCGECPPCRRARTAACQAPAPREAPAWFETVPARYLLAVDGALQPAADELWSLAALADAISAPYAALVQAQVAPGELVLVLGAGVRGRAAARLAQALGATAILLDPRPPHLEAAAALGVAHRWPEVEPAGRLLDRAAGLARELGLGVPELKIVETSGTRAGRARAIELAARARASAVLLADGDGLRVPADLAELAEAGATVAGSGPCHPDLLPELAALVVRGELRPAALCVPVLFSDLGAALSARRSGRELRLPVLVRRLDSDGGARS